MGVQTVNVIDENNSTTTPLAGGATFTGTGTDVTGYASVTVQLYADVDSAAGGMKFQCSIDNTNWDDSNDFTLDVSESDVRRFQVPVTAKFFRIVYTNGAGAQSAFRVQTILHELPVQGSVHRLGDNESTDRSCTLVKAGLIGYDGTEWVPVSVSSAGSLPGSADNSEATLLASAARTATTNSADQENLAWRGCHVLINVTVDGGGTLTPKIQGKDSISGNYYDLLVGEDIDSTGLTVIKIYPGIAQIEDNAARDILPKTWRVSIVHADANSMTYSVSANLVV